MTTCLNGKCNGDCNQGRDCPVRKQRIKEINDAYVNGYNDAQLGDPIDDLADTFKGLLTVMAVVLCGWVAFLLIWGK
jgi:hypothetical protein